MNLCLQVDNLKWLLFSQKGIIFGYLKFLIYVKITFRIADLMVGVFMIATGKKKLYSFLFI